MSLLFNRGPVLVTAFTIKSDPDRSGFDTVLLGRDLWFSLCPSPATRITVVVSPLDQPRSRCSSSLRSIVCWAALDDEVTELSIPPRWLHVYPHLFRIENARHSSTRQSVTVTISQPIQLTNVVLKALSEEAYDFVRVQNALLERWLISDLPIFRHGDLHVLKAETPDSPAYRYCIEIIEPVQQGYVDYGKTRIVFTLADQTLRDMEIVRDTESPADFSTDSDPDIIEIDERFLASSVLSDGHFGQDPNHDAHDPSAFPGTAFHATPLSYSISDEDDCTLYFRTSELSRVGVLNRDWAIAYSTGVASSRLVRVVANDDLVPRSGVAMASPVLLHNLCPPDGPASDPTIWLRSLSVRMGKPPIPTATTVTLAIIASPLSCEEPYRSILAGTLKSNLEGATRLIKTGDIIYVGTDTSALRSVDSLDRGMMEADGQISDSTSHINLVGFFSVTSIHIDATSTSASQMPSDGYARGKFGCWLNPLVTRVTQTGESRSRIPDMTTFMGADKSSPAYMHATLRAMPSPKLLSRHSAYGQLLALATAAMSRRAFEYGLRFSILLKGKQGVGKFTTAISVAQRLGFHVYEVDCYDLLEKDDTKTANAIRVRVQKAISYAPCCLILRHVEALSQSTQKNERETATLSSSLQECIVDIDLEWEKTGYPTLLIGTSSEPGRLSGGLSSCFKHELLFDTPGEIERGELLRCLLIGDSLAPNVSLADLAMRTAALVAADLTNLVHCARLNSVQRVRRASRVSGYSSPFDQAVLTNTDFEIALANIRASYSDTTGAPKIPNVAWDDVGGLASVKRDILETIQLPLDHPELFADGLKKRSGILLYGPPGTGKTLLAKAVATSCSLNFFSIKGPELLNMYIGESEANVRRVFQQARDAKPCVIFFDELDSVAPKRGNHGDSGGVMDRIVSQLLAELDGMASGKAGNDVFVIGATNRPDLLDAALLRPGRFDRMLYLGVSSTHEDQLNVLNALTRKFRLAPDVKLSEIAEQCPFNFTGADFYALCSDAMLGAMSRKAVDLERKIGEINDSAATLDHPLPLTPQYYLAELATAEELLVQVFQGDFQGALQNLVPSVSQSELGHYRKVQKQFSSRIVDAS